MTKGIQLIVGLGNPGKDYKNTRHNAGAWWVEALCQQNQISLQTQSKFQAQIAQGQVQGHKCHLAIPTTFMNHSGQAIGKIAKFYKIPPDAILVAHDELDIEPGTARLKNGGGHGGHNGLRDIIPQLGTPNFHRLRIGIGHPGNKNQVADFVLHAPAKQEEQKIHAAIDESLMVLPDILAGNWQPAMNQLHRFSA